MRVFRRQSVIGVVIVSLVAAVSSSSAIAQAPEPKEIERETRDFRIFVDGTERGQCTIQIRRRDDGTDWVGGNAGLLFNYIVYKYRFSSGGAAIWKEGRLIEMDRTASFNGTKYHVAAATTREGLVVEVNGRASLNSRDLWSTTCWQMPKHLASELGDSRANAVATVSLQDGRSPAHDVVILDADRGQRVMGRLQRVGDEVIDVAGEQKSCSHYRVTGDVDVHLWYDNGLRLVRRQSVESGHKVLMEITRIAAE
jgi:hypothetical protein